MKRQYFIISVILVVIGGVVAWSVKNRRPSSQPVAENDNISSIPIPADDTVQPTPTSEVITSQVDTSDWKIYLNEEMEFEIKYPEKFEYSSVIRQFYGLQEVFTGKFTRINSIDGADNAFASLAAYERKDNQSISEFLQGISGYAKLVDGKQYKLPSGADAYQFDHVDPEIINLDDAYLIIGNRYFYLFDNHGLNESYRDIVSTFRLVENLDANSYIDTSDWRTYQNEIVRFKYPSNWDHQTIEDGIAVTIPNNEGRPLLDNLGKVSIYFSKDNPADLLQRGREKLMKPWLDELGKERDIPEKKMMNGKNTINILGPFSPPSNMFDEIYIVVSDGRNSVVLSGAIFGGDTNVINKQIAAIYYSIYFF